MNVQQKRACTQGEKQRKGQHARAPHAPTERNCADKAPVRQQGATHKGSKTKFPFCVVLKTYHLDTWILHKTCLKHSNFLNRKTVCTIVSTWNIMATAMGQGTEENKNKLRQGSKHGNYNMHHRLIGRDLRTASSSSNLLIPLHPLDLPYSPEASNLGSRANEAIAALNRIAMSGTYVNTSCANRRK